MNKPMLAACILAVSCLVVSRSFSAEKTNDAPAAQSPWVANNAPNTTRRVGEIPLRISYRDAIVLGTVSCPVALFGQKFWDLSKLAPNGTVLPLEVEPRQLAAISDDGKMIAVAWIPGDDHNAAATIWNTRTADEIADIPMYNAREQLDFLRFAGSKYLLTIPPKSRSNTSPPLDIWDAHTGKHVRQMPCIDFNRNETSVTPDAHYLAVADKTHVVVYDLEAAQPVSNLTPPPALPADLRRDLQANQILALAYSQDAAQLAAVVGIQDPRLIIWNPRGDLLSESHLPQWPHNRPRPNQPPVIWSPNGQFILLDGHGIWDGKTHHFLYTIPSVIGSTEVATLLDNDRVLMVRRGDRRPVPSAVLEIPWNAIHAAQASLNSGSPAALKAHQSVSVQITLKNLPDDPVKAKAALLASFTDYLATQGITVANGQSIVIQLTVEQSLRQEMRPHLTPARRFPPAPAKIGPSEPLMIFHGAIGLEIHAGSDSKVIFHTDINFGYDYHPAVKDKDTALRESFLPMFCRSLSDLKLPYYLSADGAFQLPVPTEPRKQSHTTR